MNNTERTAFEAQLGQLLAGYDRKITAERVEAYWRGLAKMPLAAFDRVVDHALSERGPEELPSPRHCWQIYRDMRGGGAAANRSTFTHEPPAPAAIRWGNQWLFAYLTSKGAASRASLAKLIALKNHIAESCLSIPEDEFNPPEMKTMLFPKFDELWEAQPRHEFEEDLLQWQIKQAGWPGLIPSRAHV